MDFKLPPKRSRLKAQDYAGIAQLVEHDLAKVGVASSSLVSRSKFEKCRKTRTTQAGIAQLVEHDLAKVGVASSSLVSRSKFYLSSKLSTAKFQAGDDFLRCLELL